MSYATVAELREYLGQVKADAATDAILTGILDRMSALLDLELAKHDITFGTATVATRTVYGDGTDYLKVPAFIAGTVTGVTTISGYTVPTYVEREGLLIATDSTGRLRSVYTAPWYHDRDSDVWTAYGWVKGVPYTVTATYGYAAMPAAVTHVLREANLELAVRTWRAKDAGFSDVIGVEGAGEITIDRSYPLLVNKVLAALKDSYAVSSGSVGVW